MVTTWEARTASLEAIDPKHHWIDLGSAVRIVAERTVRGRTATTVRNYIANLPVHIGADAVAEWVRGHWASRTACTGY